MPSTYYKTFVHPYMYILYIQFNIDSFIVCRSLSW